MITAPCRQACPEPPGFIYIVGPATRSYVGALTPPRLSGPYPARSVECTHRGAPPPCPRGPRKAHAPVEEGATGSPVDLPPNLGHGGLRSVDRNNKATLPRTRPCDAIKSYAKDLPPRMVKLQSAGEAHARFRGGPGAGLLRSGAEAYSYPTTMCGKNRRGLAWVLT